MTELQKVEITPAHMLQIAVEKDADLEKLEKLMELQERWEGKQSKKAYVSAMSKFRAECPAIVKTREAHNSKYAGLAESIGQIKDLLSKCGLSHSWSTDQSDNLVTVTCTVTHIDGHSESTSLTASPDTTGSKNSIQAIGSTISYLQRYTIYALLGLASQDADTDGNVGLPPEAVESLTGAADLGALQKAFKSAWEAYPNHKKQITALKDQRKKELA